MRTAGIYLSFDGNCEQAFNYYKSIFGGYFGQIIRFKDIKNNISNFDSCNQCDKIIFISLFIGSSVLIGNDIQDKWVNPMIKGNNFSVSISDSTISGTKALFNKLAEKGEVLIPPSYTFWNDYLGMVTDPFGINWMIIYDKKLKKRNAPFDLFSAN
ncbi:VOC family protein [Chryseobacterium sp. CKR4-1]|uniref:VOC family protein n=1 Tax=Chryseobacterium sp. CKR4-1 TaxID=3068896 RepID=UPI00279661CC|nr:VOC family protein [Chryseobacterium sp. CKR4-1]MDQ1805101.1 VOC family protein [Chryseobacterium sp. CKR4-1]